METLKTKRARRRSDLARKKREARRIYPHDPKAKAAEYLRACSCWLCGNPRRQSTFDAQTMQEHRATMAEREFRAEAVSLPSPEDGAD